MTTPRPDQRRPGPRQAPGPALEPLAAIGSAFQLVRLACTSPCSLDDTIIAYVNGIKVGETTICGSFRVGEVIEFPITYLPYVDLPSEIRFVREKDGTEIATPLPISTREDAVALVGLGEVTVETFAIEHGVARGTATNRVNGLLRPEMFAKINGVVPRAVAVDSHRLLDDGGASFQFSVRIEGQDLVESGLSIDLFVIGREGSVASLVFTRADPEDVLKRVTHLEGRIDQNQQATGYQIQALDNDLNGRLNLLQDRIDTFIEYAASLLFDRVAAVEVPTVAGAPELDAEIRRKMGLFLELVRSGGKSGTAGAAGRGEGAERAVAPLRSSAFSQGWYDPEVDDGEEYRWMSSEGIVFNPQPEKPVREVEISVFGVYGAELPAVNCFFDGAPARVSRDRSADDGPLQLRVRPTRSDPATSCGMLRIESMVSASPAALEGVNDKRLLSIAVSEVAFVYAQ